MTTNYLEKYREVGRRVAFYRNIRGLSQEALAEKVGISRSYIAKIESPGSDTSFSLDVLFGIAAGLAVNVAAFFVPVEIGNVYISVAED